MLKLLSATAIILTLSAPAWAEGTASADQANFPFIGEMDEGNWSSDSILGMPVQTADGETVGQVQGIIFTPDDRVQGIVVDTGEYLGVETRPVVVDWYAIQIVPEDRLLVVDVTKEQLQNAPDYAMVEDWRAAKDAGTSAGAETAESEVPVPDIREDQPGVLTEEALKDKEFSTEGTGIGSTGGGADTGQ